MADFTNTLTLTRQPAEAPYTIAIEFAGKLPVGAALSSAVVAANRLGQYAQTSFAAAALANSSSISTYQDPKVGAKLYFADNDVIRVTATVGSGPYTLTLARPLTNAHELDEVLLYRQGENAQILVSTTATISGTQAVMQLQGGLDNTDYGIELLATLDTGVKLEEDLILRVREI